MDTWHELYAQHVDIVFWPSAYGGGQSIRGYAKLFHYNIVPAGWGDITDTRGLVASDQKQEADGIFTATIDNDKTWYVRPPKRGFQVSQVSQVFLLSFAGFTQISTKG